MDGNSNRYDHFLLKAGHQRSMKTEYTRSSLRMHRPVRMAQCSRSSADLPLRDFAPFATFSVVTEESYTAQHKGANSNPLKICTHYRVPK